MAAHPGGARRSLCLALFMGLVLGSRTWPAGASPAMVLDDAQVVGVGQVEIVVAGALLERGPTLSYEAPLVDISVGLMKELDFTLVGSPTHRVDDDEGLPVQGNLNLGMKWQFLRRSNFIASAHPAIDIDVRDSDNLVVHFPVQLEYNEGRFFWGLDTDYAVVTNSYNEWLVGTWVGWSINKSLLLLGEVWALPAGEPESVDFGFDVGFEWLTPLGVTVLTSVGTDFAAFGAERIKWRGFLGFLWTFNAWGPVKIKVRPNRPRTGDAKRMSVFDDGLPARP